MGHLHSLRLKIRSELEAPAALRRFGSGWISGVAAIILSMSSLLIVIALRYPEFFTLPDARDFYQQPSFRFGVHILLIASFIFSLLNLGLRNNKVLGTCGMTLTLFATLLGGSSVQAHGEITNGIFLGLDWFVLNILFTGFLFIPVERIFVHTKEQSVFRSEWREDLFYFLVSSLFIQCLSYLSLRPAQLIAEQTQWGELRAWVASQPIWLQFIEIMFCTDLVQYWVHRAFHRIPALWKFHAVHHSAKAMDWMAGARMHVLEIIVLRAFTVVPMFILGFTETAMHAYILAVYIHSTFIHANIHWDAEKCGALFVTPRFHHWHHGIEREAIDVNFAIHFPLFDRLFGTFYLPERKWPSGYGIKGHPVPSGYLNQFFYPFTRKKKSRD